MKVLPGFARAYQAALQISESRLQYQLLPEFPVC